MINIFKSNSKKEGLAIIELIVVLAIIGILSSVVLPNVLSSRQKGRNNLRIKNLDTLKAAMTLYYDINKTYPKTCNSVATDGTCSGVLRGNVGWVGICSLFNYNSAGFGGAGLVTDTGATGWISDLAPDYILKLPTEVFFSTNDKCYIYKSDGQDYKILAYGTVEGGGVVPSTHFFYDKNGGRNTSYAVYTLKAKNW